MARGIPLELEAATKSKEILQGVDKELLQEYMDALFPIPNCSDIFQGFCLCLSSFFAQRLERKIPKEAIAGMAVSMAKQINEELALKLTHLLTGQFVNEMVARATGSKCAQNEVCKPWKPVKAGKQRKKSKEKAKLFQVVDVDLTNNQELDSIQEIDQVMAPIQPINKPRSRSKKSLLQMKDSRKMENVFNRGICVCGISAKQDGITTFRCIHCNYHFHQECMLKRVQNGSCLPCHLERLLPNRRVLKTLFIGYLNKDKTRHTCSFEQKPNEIPSKAKVQIRCFKIKEGAQNIIQFPDTATLILHKNIIKQFTPLHRQSSLKHRKDESFIIENVLLSKKENKLIITERGNGHRNERVENYTHVLGIYLVEEKKVEDLLKETMLTSFTTLQQSQNLLLKSMRLGAMSEELTLQIIKISLCCTLSLERMQYPARGIFCQHFQCFDLQNFLIITTQSAIPRWVCPLCKLPCYAFKIDSLISAVLKKFAHKPELTEALFCKNGKFSVSIQGQPPMPELNSIDELQMEPFELKRRRKELPCAQEWFVL